MNRKHNPWVALVGLLLGLLLVILCAGCATVEEPDPGEPAADSSRFTYEHAAWLPSIGNAYIITDHDTGVQYLLVHDVYGTGMTALQTGEG